MSKRAQQQAHGWIEFRGLRFAQFYLTRHELIEYIRLFFHERGFNVGDGCLNNTLRVVFSCQAPNPATVLGESRYLWDLGLEVCIYMNNVSSRADFINTLFHELDHIAWTAEGGFFDYSLPYRDQPHEIRAWWIGSRWAEWLR